MHVRKTLGCVITPINNQELLTAKYSTAHFQRRVAALDRRREVSLLARLNLRLLHVYVRPFFPTKITFHS